MNNIIMERERKAEKIISLYRQRNFRQKDVANELGIPVSIVRRTTKEYGYEHGKEKSANNPNNLNDGQTVSPIIDFSKMDYLDKYNF